MSASNHADRKSVLLHGFRILLEFLLNAEADYLCCAKTFERTAARLNYRSSAYSRKIHTHLGSVLLRVPRLRYMHIRVSMVKRASRLERQILETLAQIHAGGVTAERAATLLKTIWTVPLPDELENEFIEKISHILTAWRTVTRAEEIANSTPPAPEPPPREV